MAMELSFGKIIEDGMVVILEGDEDVMMLFSPSFEGFLAW